MLGFGQDHVNAFLTPAGDAAESLGAVHMGRDADLMVQGGWGGDYVDINGRGMTQREANEMDPHVQFASFRAPAPKEV